MDGGALSDDLDEDDVAKFRPSIFDELTHCGRVARVLIAVTLTVVGFMLPLPYVGLAFSGILFAPAAVLLFYALRGQRRRRMLYVLGAPTALGLVLSGLSCEFISRRSSNTIDVVVAWAFATTAIAALFGHPSIARWTRWW